MNVTGRTVCFRCCRQVLQLCSDVLQRIFGSLNLKHCIISVDMMSLYIIITRWHLGEISNFSLCCHLYRRWYNTWIQNRFLILRLDITLFERNNIDYPRKLYSWCILTYLLFCWLKLLSSFISWFLYIYLLSSLCYLMLERGWQSQGEESSGELVQHLYIVTRGYSYPTPMLLNLI